MRPVVSTGGTPPDRRFVHPWSRHRAYVHAPQLRVALRAIRKRKAYVAVNISGLAVGMACCLLIVLYVRNELRYDAFHDRADRIYRVVASAGNADGEPTNANGSFAAGPSLEAEFPQVERAVRFRKMGWGETRTVANGDRRIAEEGLFFADSTVFEVFTFPLIDGDAATALRAPYSVVLTVEAAGRYFGGEDPMGRTLTIDAYNDGAFEAFTVTAVSWGWRGTSTYFRCTRACGPP